jgi:molybdopterin synthase sulfur carrier subunit
VNVRILYFASLRDAAGMDIEDVVAAGGDARGLYEEVRRRHGFSMPAERLRVAVNGEFAAWERMLADGDEIAFLPPMSGG